MLMMVFVEMDELVLEEITIIVGRKRKCVTCAFGKIETKHFVTGPAGKGVQSVKRGVI